MGAHVLCTSYAKYILTATSDKTLQDVSVFGRKMIVIHPATFRHVKILKIGLADGPAMLTFKYGSE